MAVAPDLIWFDNLKSVRSVNWYVQMLYSTNRGTNMLKLTENGNPVEGADGLYASAVWDKDSKSYIVKVANTSDKAQQVKINFKGAKGLEDFLSDNAPQRRSARHQHPGAS